ncbi:AAEL005233-PA, partial [Aedes aegypti]
HLHRSLHYKESAEAFGNVLKLKSLPLEDTGGFLPCAPLVEASTVVGFARRRLSEPCRDNRGRQLIDLVKVYTTVIVLEGTPSPRISRASATLSHRGHLTGLRVHGIRSGVAIGVSLALLQNFRNVVQARVQMLITHFRDISFQVVHQICHITGYLPFLHVTHNLVENFYLIGVQIVHRVQFHITIAIRLDANFNCTCASGRLCVDRNVRLAATLHAI